MKRIAKIRRWLQLRLDPDARRRSEAAKRGAITKRRLREQRAQEAADAQERGRRIALNLPPIRPDDAPCDACKAGWPIAEGTNEHREPQGTRTQLCPNVRTATRARGFTS